MYACLYSEHRNDRLLCSLAGLRIILKELRLCCKPMLRRAMMNGVSSNNLAAGRVNDAELQHVPDQEYRSFTILFILLLFEAAMLKAHMQLSSWSQMGILC